ncbi:MAG: hypothetical protein ACMUEL_01210 [Flavobacteriales bacterium Tduv]
MSKTSMGSRMHFWKYKMLVLIRKRSFKELARGMPSLLSRRL